MFFCPSFLKIKSFYNHRSNKFYLCIFYQLKIGTGMLLIFQLSKTNFIESIRSVWFDPCLFYGSGSGKILCIRPYPAVATLIFCPTWHWRVRWRWSASTSWADCPDERYTCLYKQRKKTVVNISNKSITMDAEGYGGYTWDTWETGWCSVWSWASAWRGLTWSRCRWASGWCSSGSRLAANPGKNSNIMKCFGSGWFRVFSPILILKSRFRIRPFFASTNLWDLNDVRWLGFWGTWPKKVSVDCWEC